LEFARGYNASGWVFDAALFFRRSPISYRAIFTVIPAGPTTPSNPDVHARKRVLAIGAHPDDVELGCGGTLAKHRARGDEVRILTLSRGAVGGNADVRAREAQLAADMLGATLDFGDLPDAAIPDNIGTIQMIEAVIRAFAPTHVYTHSLQDTHQDHRTVHNATVVAARDVPQLYCYQSPSSTVDFRPQLFVDISAYIDTKLRLIDAHASQVQRRANVQGDLIVATARYWGRYAGYVLAEPLHIVRQCM
jgi:LmbE family N-acetylglucosaminyl deacetylase